MVELDRTRPEAEPVYPLAILARKLTVGPPLLAVIIDLLENTDDLAYFIELVREYLPEHEIEIMAQVGDASRISTFAHLFGDRYFPLSDTDAYPFDGFGITDFVHHIPVDLMGFEPDDFEDFSSFRDGFILLLSMVENPFYGAEGARVPLLEKVVDLVGKGLMELIPIEGWSNEDLHRALDSTEYEGCAVFADWVHQGTGCMQLDANYSEYGPEEWDSATVTALTEEWPRVIDLQDKMFNMQVWLEEDLARNFEKLVSAVLDRQPEIVPKEQIPFPLDEEGQVIERR